jgi:hypothetical protein
LCYPTNMQFDAHDSTPPSDDARGQASQRSSGDKRTTLRRKKRKTRNLLAAVTLRPAEVFELYGIPSSSLCEYCNDPDPRKRLPSIKIEGRKGRKGSRYINHDILKAWMAQRSC